MCWAKGGRMEGKGPKHGKDEKPQANTAQDTPASDKDNDYVFMATLLVHDPDN